MKFGVIVFPGSNCDDDMVYVLGHLLKRSVRKVWHKDEELGDLDPQQDCVIVPGGFSYGDYLRAGAIARFSPIMKSVVEFAHKGGKIFGICNGFQVLCEAQLLPGVLLRNTNQKYISKNVYLKKVSTDSSVTHQLDMGRSYKMPIAHAEGRYYCDAETLSHLKEKDQILFQYCSADGEVDEAYNPNGSIENIAGICNEERNVFGMMPHPERAAEDIIGNTDGLHLFLSLLAS